MALHRPHQLGRRRRRAGPRHGQLGLHRHPHGVGGQQWTQQADGSLRNPQSGRCLDSPNGATANGTALRIWDCNGSAAQQFRLS
ncbi:ricin-type beta-trefoil lectin domain protein [Dactylosporangium sp. CA-152071]|uniref:ricin-type beta-trefoil lectin domain protein n=1 Tax=Dactylosporangium sp. CA-152071 TaxID=3239933 RepID=UPI003D8E1156